MKKELKFKEAFERLEKIVNELETDSVDLESVVKKYEEGTELVRALKEKLSVMNVKITELRQKLGDDSENEKD